MIHLDSQSQIRVLSLTSQVFQKVAELSPGFPMCFFIGKTIKVTIPTTLLLWLAAIAVAQPPTDNRAKQPPADSDAATGDSPMVIETDVFAGDSDEAVESHVTIFTKDTIYDVRTKPDRLTIAFDRNSRRFLIGRTAPPMQTSLTAADLIRFSATLHTKAVDSADPVIRFAADPKFKQAYDRKNGRLSLTSELWDYDVEVQPVATPVARKRYREFSDWFTYLNAIFRPVPPGARLELNGALDHHQVLPTKVCVTLKTHGQSIKQSSQHRVKFSLDASEQALLDKWQQEQQTLPIVEFSRFHAAAERLARQPKRDSQ